SRLAVVRKDQLTSVLIPVISTVAPERVLSEKLILTSLKIRGRVIYKHTKRLVVLLPVLLADSLIAPVAKEANPDDCFGPLVPAALRSPHALARIAPCVRPQLELVAVIASAVESRADSRDQVLAHVRRVADTVLRALDALLYLVHVPWHCEA